VFFPHLSKGLYIDSNGAIVVAKDKTNKQVQLLNHHPLRMPMDIYISKAVYHIPATDYFPAFWCKKILTHDSTSEIVVNHIEVPDDYVAYTRFHGDKEVNHFWLHDHDGSLQANTYTNTYYVVYYVNESVDYMTDLGFTEEDMDKTFEKLSEVTFQPSRLSALAPAFETSDSESINISGVIFFVDDDSCHLTIFHTRPPAWDADVLENDHHLLPSTLTVLADISRIQQEGQVVGDCLVSEQNILLLSGGEYTRHGSTWVVPNGFIGDLTVQGKHLQQFQSDTLMLKQYNPANGLTGVELLLFVAEYRNQPDSKKWLKSILVTLRRQDGTIVVVLVSQEPLRRLALAQVTMKDTAKTDRQGQARVDTYLRVAAIATGVVALSSMWNRQQSRQRLGVLRAALVSRCSTANGTLSSSLVQNALLMTGFRLPATAVFHAASGERRASKLMLCRLAKRQLGVEAASALSLADIVLAFSLASTLVRPHILGLVVAWLASVMRYGGKGERGILSNVQQAMDNVALTPESVAQVDPRLHDIIEQSPDVVTLRRRSIKYFASIRLLRTLPLFVVVFTDGTERPLDELRRALRAYAVARNSVLQRGTTTTTLS
jgi:hypothetical protein